MNRFVTFTLAPLVVGLTLALAVGLAVAVTDVVGVGKIL